MKYIDVLFISSMEYNIYISTGRRLISATSHIVLNAIEYIFKNECDVHIRCLVLCWSAALVVASFLASFLAGSSPQNPFQSVTMLFPWSVSFVI